MSDFSEFKKPSLAAAHLANHLAEGTIVLFLGAGASKAFGLPGWETLVNDLREAVKLPRMASATSSEELQRGADEVLDKVKTEVALIELIRDRLYKEVINLETSAVFANRLLIAVSALLMGSKRGHVTRVVTLNYDNLLQWFLSIYGFSVRTIYSLPELEGSEDVRIYHPHGFIPMPSSGEESSNFVILGLHSANKRLGKVGHPWADMVRHILNSGLCIFVGMSPETLSDRALGPLLTDSGEKCQNIRPLGFWLLKGDIEPAKEAEFQRNNIIPLLFGNYDKIADFLLEICKEAGARLLR